jgi:hypothetical protein
MPRTLSDTIKAVLAADAAHMGAETHDLIVLTLPVSGDQPEIVLHCSSYTGLVVDGDTYVNVLRSVSQIKFSIGANSDQATIQLENVDLTLGQTVMDTTRTLDGSKVQIKRAYRIADGTLESIILFNGVVQGVNVDEEFVTLSVVSDFTQRKAQVASRQCTQRCLWEFKSAECGWQQPAAGNPVDQAGDPDDCSLIFDDADGGCLNHVNQHRFGGVPPLISGSTTIATSVLTGGSSSGSGGSGSGGYEDYPVLRKVYDLDVTLGKLED